MSAAGVALGSLYESEATAEKATVGSRESSWKPLVDKRLVRV